MSAADNSLGSALVGSASLHKPPPAGDCQSRSPRAYRNSPPSQIPLPCLKYGRFHSCWLGRCQCRPNPRRRPGSFAYPPRRSEHSRNWRSTAWNGLAIPVIAHRLQHAGMVDRRESGRALCESLLAQGDTVLEQLHRMVSAINLHGGFLAFVSRPAPDLKKFLLGNFLP